MRALRDFAHAVRCAWAAGVEQFHRVRWLQKRRQKLFNELPF